MLVAFGGFTYLPLLGQWVAAELHSVSNEPPLRLEYEEISHDRPAHTRDLYVETAQIVLLNRTLRTRWLILLTVARALLSAGLSARSRFVNTHSLADVATWLRSRRHNRRLAADSVSLA